jgi:hypothetical protein
MSGNLGDRITQIKEELEKFTERVELGSEDINANSDY